MQPLPRHINPFALMLDPQAVIAQIERSERLEGLHRRVCRPLDKPLLGAAAEAGDEAPDGEPPVDEATAIGVDDDVAVIATAGASPIDSVFSSSPRHD